MSSPLARDLIMVLSETEEDEQQEKDAWMRVMRVVADALANPRQLPRIRRLAILFDALHDPELILLEKHLDDLCASRDIRMVWFAWSA